MNVEVRIFSKLGVSFLFHLEHKSKTAARTSSLTSDNILFTMVSLRTLRTLKHRYTLFSGSRNRDLLSQLLNRPLDSSEILHDDLVYFKRSKVLHVFATKSIKSLILIVSASLNDSILESKFEGQSRRTMEKVFHYKSLFDASSGQGFDMI